MPEESTENGFMEYVSKRIRECSEDGLEFEHIHDAINAFTPEWEILSEEDRLAYDKKAKEAILEFNKETQELDSQTESECSIPSDIQRYPSSENCNVSSTSAVTKSTRRITTINASGNFNPPTITETVDDKTSPDILSSSFSSDADKTSLLFDDSTDVHLDRNPIQVDDDDPDEPPLLSPPNFPDPEDQSSSSVISSTTGPPSPSSSNFVAPLSPNSLKSPPFDPQLKRGQVKIIRTGDVMYVMKVDLEGKQSIESYSRPVTKVKSRSSKIYNNAASKSSSSAPKPTIKRKKIDTSPFKSKRVEGENAITTISRYCFPSYHDAQLKQLTLVDILKQSKTVVAKLLETDDKDGLKENHIQFLQNKFLLSDVSSIIMKDWEVLRDIFDIKQEWKVNQLKKARMLKNRTRKPLVISEVSYPPSTCLKTLPRFRTAKQRKDDLKNYEPFVDLGSRLDFMLLHKKRGTKNTFIVQPPKLRILLSRSAFYGHLTSKRGKDFSKKFVARNSKASIASSSSSSSTSRNGGTTSAAAAAVTKKKYAGKKQKAVNLKNMIPLKMIRKKAKAKGKSHSSYKKRVKNAIKKEPSALDKLNPRRDKPMAKIRSQVRKTDRMAKLNGDSFHNAALALSRTRGLNRSPTRKSSFISHYSQHSATTIPTPTTPTTTTTTSTLGNLFTSPSSMTSDQSKDTDLDLGLEEVCFDPEVTELIANSVMVSAADLEYLDGLDKDSGGLNFSCVSESSNSLVAALHAGITNSITTTTTISLPSTATTGQAKSFASSSTMSTTPLPTASSTINTINNNNNNNPISTNTISTTAMITGKSLDSSTSSITTTTTTACVTNPSLSAVPTLLLPSRTDSSSSSTTGFSFNDIEAIDDRLLEALGRLGAEIENESFIADANQRENSNNKNNNDDLLLGISSGNKDFDGNFESHNLIPDFQQKEKLSLESNFEHNDSLAEETVNKEETSKQDTVQQNMNETSDNVGNAANKSSSNGGFTIEDEKNKKSSSTNITSTSIISNTNTNPSSNKESNVKQPASTQSPNSLVTGIKSKANIPHKNETEVPSIGDSKADNGSSSAHSKGDNIETAKQTEIPTTTTRTRGRPRTSTIKPTEPATPKPKHTSPGGSSKGAVALASTLTGNYWNTPVPEAATPANRPRRANAGALMATKLGKKDKEAKKAAAKEKAQEKERKSLDKSSSTSPSASGSHQQRSTRASSTSSSSSNKDYKAGKFTNKRPYEEPITTDGMAISQKTALKCIVSIPNKFVPTPHEQFLEQFVDSFEESELFELYRVFSGTKKGKTSNYFKKKQYEEFKNTNIYRKKVEAAAAAAQSKKVLTPKKEATKVVTPITVTSTAFPTPKLPVSKTKGKITETEVTVASVPPTTKVTPTTPTHKIEIESKSPPAKKMKISEEILEEKTSKEDIVATTTSTTLTDDQAPAVQTVDALLEKPETQSLEQKEAKQVEQPEKVEESLIVEGEVKTETNVEVEPQPPSAAPAPGVQKPKSSFHRKRFEDDEKTEYVKLGTCEILTNGVIIKVDHVNYKTEKDVDILYDDYDFSKPDVKEDLLTTSVKSENDSQSTVEGTSSEVIIDKEKVDNSKKSVANSKVSKSSPCTLPYCVLGCVCDSLKNERGPREHCGKLKCMIDCTCGQGSSANDDADIRSRLRPRCSMLNWSSRLNFPEAYSQEREMLARMNGGPEREPNPYARVRRTIVPPKRNNDFVLHTSTKKSRLEAAKSIGRQGPARVFNRFRLNQRHFKNLKNENIQGKQVNKDGAIRLNSDGRNLRKVGLDKITKPAIQRAVQIQRNFAQRTHRTLRPSGQMSRSQTTVKNRTIQGTGDVIPPELMAKMIPFMEIHVRPPPSKVLPLLSETESSDDENDEDEPDVNYASRRSPNPIVSATAKKEESFVPVIPVIVSYRSCQDGCSEIIYPGNDHQV